MRSALIFLLGLASATEEASEYAEVARKAMAEEREQVHEAKVEDVDASTTGFDSKLQAANDELDGIMSNMDKFGKQDVQQHGAAFIPPAVTSGDSVDFAPEDAMRLHLAQLQSKVKASNSLSQKLRGAVLDRDHEIHQAEALMKKELDALAKTVAEKKKEAAEETQLEAEQVSLQDHINGAKRQLQETESQTRDEESKRVSTGSEAAKLHDDVKVANEAEVADEKKLADFKEQSSADNAKSLAQIQKLQATITAMQSQVAGGIASHVHWEKNATALTQKLQEAKATLQTMLVAKQSSDVDMSQVVGRWKDSLAQLRNQVKMNSELQQRAQQDGQSAVDHLNDLKQQVHDRDERIAQLKQRLSQH